MSWLKDMFSSRSDNGEVNCHPTPPIREDTHSPIVREPEPEPSWEHCHSDYMKRYVCHCGYYTHVRLHVEGICPKCGCEELPTQEVGRFEWECDKNFFLRRSNRSLSYVVPPNPWNGYDCREVRWVKKGEGCGKDVA